MGNPPGVSRYRPRWHRLWMAVPLVVLVVSGEGVCAWKARRTWVKWESPTCKAEEILPLRMGCDAGLLTCCTNLGVAYRDGKGVTKDVPTAQAILEGTCRAPYGRACEELGDLHFAERHFDLSYKAHEEGCHADYTPSCLSQARMLQYGTGTDRNTVQARPLFEKACASDDGNACAFLGEMWDQGSGGIADDAKAGEYLDKSSRLKSSLGDMFWMDWKENSVKSRHEMERLVPELHQVCNWRSQWYCRNFAHWAESRPSSRLSTDEINALLEKASQDKESFARNDLLVRRYLGIGGQRDTRQAYTEWSKDCRQEGDDACGWLEAVAKDTAEFDQEWPDTPLMTGVLAKAAIGLSGTAPERSEAIAARLEGHPDWSKQVHLIRVFNHLSREAWNEAQREVAYLKDDPIAPVLRAFIRSRQQNSRESWTTALVTAWVDSGQPDLRKSAAFPKEPRWKMESLHRVRSDSVPPQPLAGLVATLERDLPSAFRSRANWPEPPPDALVQRALTATDSDRPGLRMMALLVLAHPSIDSSLREIARARARQLLAEFAKEEPTNAYWPMIEFFMEPVGWSLSSEQLQRLEAITTRTTYDSHRPEMTRVLREGFHEWNVPNIESRTDTILDHLELSEAISSLRKRFQRSMSLAPPHDRARLMKVGLATARLLAEAGAFSERTDGGWLQRGILEANDLPGTTSQCDTVEYKASSWDDTWGDDSPIQLTRWPLPKLRSEMDDRLVAGQVAFMGELDALSKQVRAKSAEKMQSSEHRAPLPKPSP
jgi:TPR repeat protein